MSRKRHSKMSKEAEAPGKTKAINPSCGTQDQNENGIFPLGGCRLAFMKKSNTMEVIYFRKENDSRF